ncbi:MAG: hypothetical protein ABL973_12920 [Micropepsaceae bacterium]
MKTFTRVFATAAAAIMLAGAAWAGNMEARYGNTVVATAPDGTVTKFHYDKAGTFTVTSTQPGKPATSSKGKWRVDGDKVCLTAEATFGPFEAGKERCVPLMGDKVGDTWKSKGMSADGKPVDVDVTIVAGQ